MSFRPEETAYDSLNASLSGFDLDDLPTYEERKLSGIVRGVFVNYGMRSIMVRQDVDESLTEVKRIVEAKTGIPMDEQVLAWEGSGVEIEDEQSLRNYGYLSGGFCRLTKAN